MKYHIVQVSDEALSVTCLDLFYLCTIMTLEIKILQFLLIPGKRAPKTASTRCNFSPSSTSSSGTAVSGRASGKRRLRKEIYK